MADQTSAMVERWCALLVAALWLLAATTASAQQFPPLTGRVVDAAKLLDADQVTQLDQLSAAVEQASSRQLVVATVPSLQGYTIEDYGYRLGRAWGIGQKGANNGVILLVAPSERKVRVEVGYGLEPIVTDAYASIVVNQTILPRFRDGDMAGGIVAGAQQLAEQLKLPLEAAERRAAQASAKPAPAQDEGGEWTVAAFWIAVVLVFVLLPLLRRSAGGRRYRGGFAPVVIWGGGGSGWGGGSSGGGFSGGGFSGGGGSFGGGGASGSW
ncbi:TPM domain-containing protein [Sphingomonas phyllosphaerae]|uniref:TPM domain-containing protein n=1 Tax=Sphingomonas phyllosphaerae TaxID=257003 RepID=UPI00241385AE|nr:TPM domain-containing protein [Sphingomonas phyllosphaerae]